ncbi:MAG TPA: hypothetical protein VM779_01510 [Thermoanaerobaculia bacterium]|nr:hypothetical protein [Thermoanaerobaculia bacterium]
MSPCAGPSLVDELLRRRHVSRGEAIATEWFWSSCRSNGVLVPADDQSGNGQRGSFRVTGLQAETYAIKSLRGEIVAPNSVTVSGATTEEIEVEIKASARPRLPADGDASARPSTNP